MSLVNKLIQRRAVPLGEAVSSDPLLDRLYRARQIQHPQQLDRTLAALYIRNNWMELKRRSLSSYKPISNKKRL